MKVLVIGKGGREHALVWKLAQSPRVERVFCAPGNAGAAEDGVNVPIEASDCDYLIRFAKKEAIGLTVVGPEDPLAAGIVDAFQKAGLRIFGPSREAARLEASKVFAKKLMRHADVPTAEFRVFDHPEAARRYVYSREVVTLPTGQLLSAPFPPDHVQVRGDAKYYVGAGKPLLITPPAPVVVKADGLAAGKGVVVCNTTEEAVAAIERIMVREEFGRNAGRQVVIEKRLEGQELSIQALVSGRALVPLPATQDHKAAFDNDTGPNTGGMGAYCPAPLATPELLDTIETTILVPTAHAMKRGRRPFRGVLYAGIMVTNQGPRVLEFNCRFGDPEVQPLLMRLRSDLLDLLEAVVDDRLGELDERLIEWDPRPAVCVVMASLGYPGPFAKGKVISGLGEADRLPDVKVFHAATRMENGVMVTDGGRVLGVTALGETLADAKRTAYEAVGRIHFQGAFYRHDIADKALTTETQRHREDQKE
jgi:phosphoribosylamine--glycine ligase